MAKIIVQNVQTTVLKVNQEDYISLTDMMKAKDGEFFVTDWLRNRNTLEYIGIWEKFYNPTFNYGEFAIIKSQAGLLTELGQEWLKNAAVPGGVFDVPSTQKEYNDISKAYNKLLSKAEYSHSQLLAAMGFGFWKYCFSQVQYRLLSRSLLRAFPAKPRSSALNQYNKRMQNNK